VITEYHAKLFAHAEKLAGALLDAQVDLNQHQVEAALFAFKSPLSKGAILADEVGLGKTIEVGLVRRKNGRKDAAVSSSSRLRPSPSRALSTRWRASLSASFATIRTFARNWRKPTQSECVDGVALPSPAPQASPHVARKLVEAIAKAVERLST